MVVEGWSHMLGVVSSNPRLMEKNIFLRDISSNRIVTGKVLRDISSTGIFTGNFFTGNVFSVKYGILMHSRWVASLAGHGA